MSDLSSLRWQPTDLEPAESELVLAIAPWGTGFVAAGTSMDFARAQTAEPSENPLARLMRAEFWRSDDGLHWVHVPSDDSFVGARVQQLVPFGDRLLAFGTLGVCLPDACGGLPPNGGTVVWESRDGASWTLLQQGGLEAGAVVNVVSTGSGLIAGGYVASSKPAAEGAMSGRTDAAVWRSSDGRTWSRDSLDAVDARVIRLASDAAGNVAALLATDTEYAKREPPYQVWRSRSDRSGWVADEGVADLTIDAAGATNDVLLTGWRADDPAAILTISPVAGDKSHSTKPGLLGAISTTSITDTGSAVLLAGNALDPDGKDLPIGKEKPVLMASEDLSAWSTVSAPPEWLDSAPIVVAVNGARLVTILRPPYPVSPKPPSTIWVANP